MKTKTFDGFFGPKEVSRKEFINQWIGTTGQYASLFYPEEMGEELLKFQQALEKVAGKAWDKHESWSDKAEAAQHAE